MMKISSYTKLFTSSHPNLIKPVSRADPVFKPSFLYSRLTAEELRAALFEEKIWRDEDDICQHLGKFAQSSRLSPLLLIQKTESLKKIKEADLKAFRVLVDVKAELRIKDSKNTETELSWIH